MDDVQLIERFHGVNRRESGTKQQGKLKKTREIVFYAFSQIIVEKLKNVGTNSIACLTRNNNGKRAVTFKLDPFIRISYTIRKEQ